MKNAGLSRLFGAGKWQQLFDDATPSIVPAAAATVAGGDPLCRLTTQSCFSFLREREGLYILLAKVHIVVFPC
eukprot:6635944-Prymnesium_polylepis.3